MTKEQAIALIRRAHDAQRFREWYQRCVAALTKEKK